MKFATRRSNAVLQTDRSTLTTTYPVWLPIRRSSFIPSSVNIEISLPNVKRKNAASIVYDAPYRSCWIASNWPVEAGSNWQTRSSLSTNRGETGQASLSHRGREETDRSPDQEEEARREQREQQDDAR